MVFFQAAAPTGWTQDVTHNDKALRVVSGAGGGSGGTNAFSTNLTHTHTIASSGTHSHGVNSITISGGPSAFYPYGVDGAHTHTTDGGLAIAFQYIDVIVCSKN